MYRCGMRFTPKICGVFTYLLVIMCTVVRGDSGTQAGIYAGYLMATRENQLSAIERAKNVFKELKLVSNVVDESSPVGENVSRIGKLLIEAANLNDDATEWEFVVLDDPDMVQAFSMPKGKIVVFTGLLNLLNSDDEIAIVLSHEIAHLERRHMVKEIRRKYMLTLSTMREARLDDPESDEGEIFVGYNRFIAMENTVRLFDLMAKSYNRRNEREADFLSLFIAASAGYDPNAGLTVWQKIEAMAEQSTEPPYLITHPSEEVRLSFIKSYIPSAEIIREQAQNGDFEYGTKESNQLFRQFFKDLKAPKGEKPIDLRAARGEIPKNSRFTPEAFIDERPLLSVGTRRLGMENSWGMPTRVYVSTEEIPVLLAEVVAQEAHKADFGSGEYIVSGVVNEFDFEMGFSPLALKFNGFLDIVAAVITVDGEIVFEKEYTIEKTRNDYSGFSGKKVTLKLFQDLIEELRVQARSDFASL